VAMVQPISRGVDTQYHDQMCIAKCIAVLWKLTCTHDREIFDNLLQNISVFCK
jgi:hypothetical protein